VSKSEVSIQIPDELIKGIVMAEMSKALGNRDDLIRGVVAAAFTAKDPNSYGRETIFEKQVKEAINNMAAEAFKTWLAENAAKVKEAVLRELNKRKAHFADQMATALLEGRFYVKPTISVQIGTDDR
jgi:hypothetical protein